MSASVVADLCLKHRVRRLALFGSGASERFDSAKGSDLDFLAEFEPMSPREHAGAYFRLTGTPISMGPCATPRWCSMRPRGGPIGSRTGAAGVSNSKFMPLTPGLRLGPYEVLSAIGAGGMGEVYKARDTRLDRTVAIKVLPEHIALRDDPRARFEREARAVASLNHPNICTLFDIGPNYMVLELIEGETLAARIQKGAIPLDQAIALAVQIADALDRAHRAGVTHRDVKPQNIMLTRDGVKVLDFGLAKTTTAATPEEATMSRVLTTEGTVMGTPQYMAPEQFEGREADARSDVWAFGAVLYEMVTGRKAFEGKSYASLVGAILASDPRPMSLTPFTPSWVERLVKRCLAKDAEDRWQSMRDVVIELKTPLLQPAAAGPATGAQWRWVVATGVLSLSLAAALWAPWRERPTEPPMNQFVILPPEKAHFGRGQAISPDGRKLAFAATVPGEASSLWLRRLDSLSASRLAGTEDAQSPFWSPDGKSLGFLARGKLRRIDLTGGPAQTLADVSFWSGAAWSPWGTIVFSPRFGALSQIPAGGGEAVALTEAIAAKDLAGWPSFLPDGRHFLFYRSRGTVAGTYVGSRDSKEVRLILPRLRAIYSAPGFLLFLSGSTLMAQPFDLAHLSISGDPSPIAERVGGFTVSANQTLLYAGSVDSKVRLVWADRAGKEISEAAPADQYGSVDLSRDGKRVVFHVPGPGGSQVKQRDLERGITSVLTLKSSNVPLWSPDGKTVVFAVTSGLDLGQRPADMSAPESVLLKLSAPPLLVPSDWSADGRYLAYFRTDPKTQLDLWILPLFGDRQPLPFLHGDFNESQGQFSPDGRWMAYVSDESGTPQINVASFPVPAGIRQISADGGSQPRWRRDGKELFFVGLDGKLMATSVKIGATFEAEAPHPLFDTTPLPGLRQPYSVSPDGRRFLLSVPVEVSSAPLTVIQNWTGALKK